MINTVPTENNGITKVIYNLSASINKEDITIDLLSINKPDYDMFALFKSIGVEIHVIENRLKNPLLYFKTLCNLIKEKKYDIVHAHGNSYTLAIELFAAKFGRCKNRIAHSHNTTCKYKLLHYLMAPLFNLCCTDRLACGTDAGRWLYNNKEFIVIKNGIDTEKFRFNVSKNKLLRQQMNLSDDTLAIGHVGCFNTQKNHDFLIEVFRYINKKNQNSKLILIGDGFEKEKIKQKVKLYGLEKVVLFIGEIENVYDYMSAFDIVIMPSLYEGLPLTLVEEQANGLTCIVSDVITKEADLTGNIIFESLSSPVDKWGEKVLGLKVSENRIQKSDIAINKILKKEYDIIMESKRLKEHYYSLM